MDRYRPWAFRPKSYSVAGQADRDDFNRLDTSDQGVAAGVVNLDIDELTGLSPVAVKDDDAITVGAAGHLCNHGES